MSDLRAAVLGSLSGGGAVVPKQKVVVRKKMATGRPTVVLKKKKQVEKHVVVVKRKAETVPEHIETEDEVGREALKRSRTINDIEMEGRVRQANMLESQGVILREKAEALLAENESKDLIIAHLKEQLAEKEQPAEPGSKLAEALVEAAEWEAQARQLVDEGNAAIESIESERAATQEKYDKLHAHYTILCRNHKEVRKDAAELEEELDDKEELVEKQHRRILSLSAQRSDVELTEKAAIKLIEEKESLLVATMAALEDAQKRLVAAKNREEKGTRDTSSLKAQLQKALADIKALKGVESEWIRRWASLNQGKVDMDKEPNMSNPDESAEISRIKAANTSLEFQLCNARADLSQATKDLTNMEKSMTLRVAERDALKKDKDRACVTIEKLTESIKKKDIRLNKSKEMAEGFQARMKEIEERASARHTQALARMEESKAGALASAEEEYNRVQIELADLQVRYGDVCKDLDDLRKPGAASNTGELQRTIAGLEVELTKYKESYTKVVESNKKWQGVYDGALAKIAEWKAAEVAWVAEKARMEEACQESTQQLIVMEHRSTPTRNESGGDPSWPSDYTSVIESMASAFCADLKQAFASLASTDFQPDPTFLQVMNDFPIFQDAMTKLMNDRNKGLPFDPKAFDLVNQFLGADFSMVDSQAFPLENVTSIFHVVMTMIESYAKRDVEHNNMQDAMMGQLNETMAKINKAFCKT